MRHTLMSLAAVLVLAGCADAPTAAAPPRALPDDPSWLVVPSLPVPEAVVKVGEAVRRHAAPGFLVTVGWTDTAEGEFQTCFKFAPASKQADHTTQCVYASTYGDGTGPRTAAVPVTRGTYAVTAWVGYYVDGGPHPRSLSSDPPVTMVIP
jgi:hypothetical protein